jgi:hypothetical protein
MGVTTTLINKPFNPRAQDQSPKGYNRASLFSGKALDFDGVNDRLDGGSIDALGTGDFSYSVYFNPDGFSSYHGLFAIGTIYNFGLLTHQTTGQVYAYSTTTGDINSGYFLKDGEWQHITFVKSGTSHKFYINGKLFSDITDTEFSVSAGNYKIGQITSYFANGQYSNARLFNTALTAAQVADLYNNPEKVVPTGVDNTALKLWLPMMEGAGTTAYNGAPDALGSELVTNGTFDTDSDWFKGTGWTISGGKANRSGASGNSPVYQNVPVVNGKRYIFSYTRTYISGGGETNVFVKLDNVNYSTIGRYVSTITEEHKVIGEFTAGFTGNLLWQIYGITDFTGSIDNVEIKEMTGYGTISGATWTHGIGAPVAQTSVIDWNKHTLDGTNEVLIPQGLTSGRDLLGNLFENVRKQGALNLDGNSWAEVHDNASLDVNEITAEGWMYAESITGTNNRIVNKWNSGYPERSFQLYGQHATINWMLSDGSAAYSITGGTLSQGQWHHLVGTYDGSTQKIYLDGVQVATTALSITLKQSSFKVMLGGYATGVYSLNPIAQPRIYNRALTAEEVQRNYNAGKNTYTNS